MARAFRLQVTLKQYLASINVSTYTLSQWVDGISPKTIYAIASGSRRPSLGTIELILTALRAHGFNASLGELLNVVEARSKSNNASSRNKLTQERVYDRSRRR
jgi:transcriptional regulator with XRE-family HTH domain